MPDEVDESVAIIINMCGTAVDVIKSILQTLTFASSQITKKALGTSNGIGGSGDGGGGFLLTKPLVAGANFVKKYIPNVGHDGQIRVSQLSKLDGDNVCIGQFQDKELKQLKKALRKHGIEFSAIKLKDSDSYNILIKARQSQIANHVIENVIREEGLLSDKEIDECCSQLDVDLDAVSKDPKGLLTEAISSIEREGNTWNLLRDHDGELLYKTEYGKFDLLARSNGSWQVICMGEAIDYGQNITGLSGAMLDARIHADVANSPKTIKTKIKEFILRKKEQINEKKASKVKTPAEENKRAQKLSAIINNKIKNRRGHNQNIKNNQNKSSGNRR